MAINTTQTSLSPSQLAAQNLPALRQVFENIQADSCPRSYNFHMHTVYSDGRLQPQALLEQAVNIGLRGFAITDHHSTRGYQIAQRHLEDLQLQANNPNSLPQLWTGVEITSDLLGTEVHILGYAFNPEHPALQPYLQSKAPRGEDAWAVKVISALHQAGGLVVLAHPARYRRPAKQLIPAVVDLGIDGVETYYAYNNPNPWEPSYKETEQVKQLAATYGLLNTCGTDTHGLNLLQRI